MAQLGPGPATNPPTGEQSGALGKGRMECSPSTGVATLLLAGPLWLGEGVEEKSFLQKSDLFCLLW